jgi:hypothetical protein
LNKIVTNFPMSLTDEENRNLALTLSAVVEGGGGGSADAIWKPAVNEDGILSWTWDENPNPSIPPASANIKGPRGESGAPGRDGTNGTNGTDGKTPQIQINSSNAHWEWRYSGASEWTDLGVVASGAVGPQGIPGVSGASGAPGAPGANGQDGYSPSVTTSEIPSSVEHPQGGTSVTITDKTGDHQFDVWNGINGEGASVNLLDGSGIHIEQNGINYTIGVSADYALKSELPDVTDMATKTWVGQQGYLTSVPDSYATKEYANDTSANALSQAQSWVGSQNFLKQADLAGYATETWVNQQHFATSADLATRVMVPDSADVNLKDKYLVLRTKADGTVDGWTDFQNQSYSKSEADGRYMRKETDATLDGVGTSADKLRISDTVMNEIEAKSSITSAAGNVFTVSGGAGTEPNKNFVYSGVNYKTNLSEPTYAPQRLAVVTGDGEIISHYNDYTEGVYGTLFFVTSAHV